MHKKLVHYKIKEYKDSPRSRYRTSKNVIIFVVYRQWGNRQIDEVIELCNKINKAS